MALSEERQKEIRKKHRRQAFVFYLVFFCLCALILAGLFFGVRGVVRLATTQKAPTVEVTEAPPAEEPLETAESILAAAERLAAGYDYDGAIAHVKSFAGYAENETLTAAINRFTETKATLVPANISEVTHVFFHTLLVDTARAFDGEYTADGYNQYMTTVSEFRAMLSSLYARGFVLVNMDDMARLETGEDGLARMTKCEILLPPDKKPLVMSQDDVSYYQYMKGDGFASRLVIGEDGYPTCEYIAADGSVTYGDYDLVPILERFIAEHPDFSYRGARATLAVTGYDGVLGYRTCPSGEEYNEEDIPKAKAVADRLRELGWVFASHSWGHRYYGSSTVAEVRTDAEKWKAEVAPILGDTDILIYAHGEDIGGIKKYSSENEKYNILKEMGFRYFCNVDSNPYWVQIGDDYMRQGRRNLDGYRMYHNPEKLSDLFTVSEVWDAARPVPVPAI